MLFDWALDKQFMFALTVLINQDLNEQVRQCGQICSSYQI